MIRDTKGWWYAFERGYNRGYRDGYEAAKAAGYTPAPLTQEGNDEK